MLRWDNFFLFALIFTRFPWTEAFNVDCVSDVQTCLYESIDISQPCIVLYWLGSHRGTLNSSCDSSFPSVASRIQNIMELRVL